MNLDSLVHATGLSNELTRWLFALAVLIGSFGVLRAVRSFVREGVEFAFPTQALFLEDGENPPARGPAGRSERAAPAAAVAGERIG